MPVANKPMPLTQDQQRVADDALQHVRDMVVSVPKKGEKPTARDELWLQRINPDTRTIAILGERGTGKTFVMMHLLQQSKTGLGKDVGVLPILDATIASPQDSLRFFIVHVLEQALCWDRKEEDKRDEKFTFAWSALGQARQAMVGTDFAWRQETARLSAGQHDFAVWSKQRVDSTLGFPSKLHAAVDAICECLSKKVLVLPIDDVDLAPQRFLQIAEVLNELRYCPRLIVVMAADPADAVLRVCTDMLRAGEDHQRIKLEDEDWRQQRRMAHRILGKLLPERYRGHLLLLAPGQRTHFPPEHDVGGLPKGPAIGNLLIEAKLASTWSAFATNATSVAAREPLWGYVLPPSLRALSDLQAELRVIVTKHANSQESGKSKQRRVGASNYWAYAKPEIGHVVGLQWKALATVARYADLTRWAADLEAAANRPGEHDSDDQYFLIEANFALETMANDTPADVSLLRESIRLGLPLERWLPLRDVGHIVQRGALAEPEVRATHFAPLCIDLLLRYRPDARLTLPVKWAFAKKVLGSGLDVPLYGSSASVESIERTVEGAEASRQRGSMAMLFRILAASVSRSEGPAVPIASSWADLIELLEAFAGMPNSRVMFATGFVDELEPVRPDFLRHGRWLPNGVGAEHSVVLILALLHKLLHARCALARQRTSKGRELFAPHPIVPQLPETPWLSDLLQTLSDLQHLIQNGPPSEHGTAPEPDAIDPDTGDSVTLKWPPSKVWQHIITLLPSGRLFSTKHWAEDANRLRNYEENFRKKQP